MHSSLFHVCPGLAAVMLAAGCSSTGSEIGDVPARVDVGDAASRADVGDAASRADVGDAAFQADVGDAPSRADVGLAVDAGYVVDPCTSLCNAVTPSYPSIGQGEGMGDVTMYATSPSSGGACNYGETNINYYVASNVNIAPGDGKGQWQGGRACGQCVEVTAQTTTGPRSVVVRITDRCADEFCGMDLGGLAPAQIMPDGFGRYRGTWRFVSCAGHPEVSDGPPSLNVISGSNPYWALVQVRNPPWPVAAIDWQQQGNDARGSFDYAGVSYENAFQVPQTVLQADARFTLTIRYTDGSTAQLDLTSAQLASEQSYPLGP